MKASATLIALLLTASVAFGQEQAAAGNGQPDYSRDRLLWLTSDEAQRLEEEPLVTYHVGAVQFRAIGSDWRFVYLPIMAPMSGSRMTTTFHEWPDPFSLTGTAIATSPRAWRTQRSYNAELRRIEASERARIRVRVGGASSER
ncbi:MAG TPA: hypothetical protein VF701_19150 [Thermoanaerobaculia bacterium]